MLLAGVSAPSSAGGPWEKYKPVQVPSSAVMVRGMPSCGQWVKDRHNNDWSDVDDQNWLLGYLSGIAVTSNQDFLRTADNVSLFLWVDNYCHRNSLNSLDDAGGALAKELARRR